MTPEAKRLVSGILKNPVRIAPLVGFDRLTGLHNGWIKQMINGSGDITLLGHRASYKTTCLSISLALLIILKPFENIIFMRKTDVDVTDIIKQTRKILESDAIRSIVGTVYKVELKVYSTMFQIDTNLNTSTKGNPQLLGIGTASSITGKHADIIFTDDIVNFKDRVSPAERERTKLLYMELQNIKNREGRIFNTGTPWHKEDAISLMPNVHRYDCYSTDLINKDKLAQLRAAMTPSLFAANYELKHIAAENALFDAPSFTDNEELIHNGIAHIDAAYGGDDATAFTICRKQPGGRYVMFGMRYEKHVDDCVDNILAWHRRYQAGTLYCERNADKGYLAKELRAKGVPVATYNERTNKYIKIASYLKKEWRNIDFLDTTDPGYINEILDYSENAAHDDSPDSAASIIRQLETRVTLNRSPGLIGGI